MPRVVRIRKRNSRVRGRFSIRPKNDTLNIPCRSPLRKVDVLAGYDFAFSQVDDRRVLPLLGVWEVRSHIRALSIGNTTQIDSNDKLPRTNAAEVIEPLVVRFCVQFGQTVSFRVRQFHVLIRDRFAFGGIDSTRDLTVCLKE